MKQSRKTGMLLSIAMVISMLLGVMTPAVSANAATKQESYGIGIELLVGETQKLTVGNANGTVSGKVTWASADKTIATVSTAGKVTAVKAGTTIVTATYNKIKYRCYVTVLPKPALSKTTVTITEGKSYTLKLNHATQKVTWSSSKKSVATVTSQGKITAVKAGTATITAISDGVKYTCKVTVKSAGAPASVKAIQNANIGDIVKYGTYEQDNNLTNGAEAIEWIVLDKKDGKVLLLSKYALDAKPYNETRTSVTWETCTLRNWLNEKFYTTAFSKKERAYIAETFVKNEDNPMYGTEGGRDTKDKVFLLSIGEVTKYFDPDPDAWDPARTAKVTEYAKAQGVAKIYISGEYAGNGWWWLRSPGDCRDVAALVSGSGDVDREGDEVYYPYVVRPALWIAP